MDVSGKAVLFPPEKLLLLALVPPLVLTPLRPDQWQWGREQPGTTFAVALPVTLLVLIPLALFLEHMRPGWTHAPIPVRVYGLAYHFLVVLQVVVNLYTAAIGKVLL